MQEEDKVFEKGGIFIESETMWIYFIIQDDSLLGRNNCILGELKNTFYFFIFVSDDWMRHLHSSTSS